MRPIRFLSLFFLLAVAVAAATTFACAKKEAAAPVAESQPSASPAPADGGKIPVTTASAEAKTAFLEGRDLAEKLRITDSHAHFEKAVSLDPNFALAELNVATSAPTGKDFFDHLGKAVSLADKASNGERLLILQTEAGANANTTKQKEYLDQLVAAYPNDERAHFAMGGYYFGQQDYAQAIEHYRKATEIAPDYSTAWNILGYAYRQAVDYPNAEKAFQKYIELIPKDPNPYDSYAELLLKEGKFDESIAQYRKALEIEPNFLNAHQGIAAALMYQGKAKEADAELVNITKKARNDGERRLAMFVRTVLLVDGGKPSQALAEVDKQYALGKKTSDVPAMAGDLQLKGNILLDMGKPADAKAAFEQAVTTMQASNLSQEVKNNNKLVSHYNLARVAIAQKDPAGAKSHAEEFRKGAEAGKNPNQVRLAHELNGLIAMAEKNYPTAISELQQANQQNPQNLYRLCQAYQASGDAAKAKELCGQAAGFNSLPAVNYAFVRTKAKAAA
jgi:tetratricopeptide (TPR) repeat protein